MMLFEKKERVDIDRFWSCSSKIVWDHILLSMLISSHHPKASTERKKRSSILLKHFRKQAWNLGGCRYYESRRYFGSAL